MKRYATPYDPATDKYEIRASVTDVVVDRAAPPKAIYDMHSYWSKKHWTAIREYLAHYLPSSVLPEGPGLVLDPFAGSGMTGVASLLSGRSVVLVDVSPSASFLEHLYCHPVVPGDFNAALDQAMDLARERLDEAYSTTCHRCHGDAELEYCVWAERFQCPSCAEIVPITELASASIPGEHGKLLCCPGCLSQNAGRAHKRFAVSTRGKRFGAIPVRVSVKCLNGCRPARGHRARDSETAAEREAFERLDAGASVRPAVEHIRSRKLKRKMLDSDAPRWGVKWRPNVAELRRVVDLFTARNATAVDALLSSIDELGLQAQYLCGPLNAGLFFVSRMCRAAATNYTMGVYSFPPYSKEINARKTFLSKSRVFREAMDWLHQNYSPHADACISNQSATDLSVILPNSVDYVFTDPPYLNLEVQYGEMNFPWDAVLGAGSSYLADEVALNPVRRRDWQTCVDMLRRAFAHCYRVLKPGRYASVCYHDASEDNWKAIQDVLLDAGFDIVSVNAIVSKQKAEKQVIGEKVVKSDLVVNCRKPRANGARGNEAARTAEERHVASRVREILIETLSTAGGQPRDRLWDVVLKRLLARGQMAEYRFEDILASVAVRSESGRYFLKEEFEALSDSDLKNEEHAADALVRFARLRMIGAPVAHAAHIALSAPHLAGADIDEGQIERYIKLNLIKDAKLAAAFTLGGRMSGVEFYDCLFFYLTRYLKGRAAGKTPRRNLAEFMDEYLVHFKDGDKWLYRPPNDAEAATQKSARQSGLGRRIRQYVAFLRGEGDYPRERIPDPKTLLAWLRHCAWFGLPTEGVVLFEKGGLAGQLQQLGETERDDAEDYYAQCRRRSAAKAAEEERDDEAGETEGDQEGEDA